MPPFDPALAPPTDGGHPPPPQAGDPAPTAAGTDAIAAPIAGLMAADPGPPGHNVGYAAFNDAKWGIARGSTLQAQATLAQQVIAAATADPARPDALVWNPATNEVGTVHPTPQLGTSRWQSDADLTAQARDAQNTSAGTLLAATIAQAHADAARFGGRAGIAHLVGPGWAPGLADHPLAAGIVDQDMPLQATLGGVVRPASAPSSDAGPAEVPPSAAAPSGQAVGERNSAPPITDYWVRLGDTLAKIAQNSGTTVAALATLNPNIRDLNAISAGDTLHLPAADANLLADEYIRNHVNHVTIALNQNGNEIEDKSEIRPELKDALNQYAGTSIGQKILRYEIANNIVHKFAYDPTWDGAKVADDMIHYNPQAVGRPSIMPGDARPTQTLTVAIAHEFGHTPSGLAALGLPTIPMDIDPDHPNDGAMMGSNALHNELRVVHLFENPVRLELNLPLRHSYYQQNDVDKA